MGSLKSKYNWSSGRRLPSSEYSGPVVHKWGLGVGMEGEEEVVMEVEGTTRAFSRAEGKIRFCDNEVAVGTTLASPPLQALHHSRRKILNQRGVSKAPARVRMCFQIMSSRKLAKYHGWCRRKRSVYYSWLYHTRLVGGAARANHVVRMTWINACAWHLIKAVILWRDWSVGRVGEFDGQQPEHIKYGGYSLLIWLQCIFNSIIRLEPSLKVGVPVPVFKGKGRDPL